MKAFPALRTEQYQDVDGNWRAKADDGMDLRDYFAAKAMEAIINKSDDKSINIVEVDNWIGDYAYVVADAMMKARKE